MPHIRKSLIIAGRHTKRINIPGSPTLRRCPSPSRFSCLVSHPLSLSLSFSLLSTFCPLSHSFACYYCKYHNFPVSNKVSNWLKFFHHRIDSHVNVCKSKRTSVILPPESRSSNDSIRYLMLLLFLFPFLCLFASGQDMIKLFVFVLDS